MVAAGYQTRRRNNQGGLVVVPNQQLRSADEHSRILSCLWRGGAQLATDTLLMAWLRGGYRHGAAASWLLLVDTKGGHDAAYTPPPDLLMCRHPCTSLSREKARLHPTAVACQVRGSLQNLLCEYIRSINSLEYYCRTAVALISKSEPSTLDPPYCGVCGVWVKPGHPVEVKHVSQQQNNNELSQQ